MTHKMKSESLPARSFYTIKGFANLYDTDLDENVEKDDIWETIRKRFSDGSVERLKKVAGSENVYMLFCYTVERNNEKKCYVCSYDIACEKLSNENSSEFDIIKLEACEYVLYDCEFDSKTPLWDAHTPTDLLFWGDNGWLANNPYVCAIDILENTGKGYAQIELYTPFDIDAIRFNMKIWYPVIPK